VSWLKHLDKLPSRKLPLLFVSMVTSRRLHHRPSLLVSFTCVQVVVVDSKACCLVSLKGISTAMEMAILLFNFCNFGLLEDIVSDRVYHQNMESILLPTRCDCKSLCSGYHHQSRQVGRSRGRLKRLVAS